MGLTKPAYFNEFCKIGTLRTVTRGECLYDLDQPHHYVYCLEEGLCALLSITKSGEEKIYRYFDEGSLISFTPAYTTLPPTTHSSAFYIYAKTNCTVYQISYQNFYNCLSENPALNKHILNLFANYFTEVLNHFHFMQEASTSSRLCKTLIDFSYKQGHKHIVHKHFTYVELAKYLGVHTVTVSRIMSALKHQGAITKEGHCIILKDIPLLNTYIQEAKILSY